MDVAETDTAKRAPWWRSPFLVAGFSIWGLCLVAWGVAWILSPPIALGMGATFAAFLVGGKLAGIPTGLSFGLPPWLAGAIVVVPDSGALLVTYPLMEKGWEVAGRWSHMLRSVRDSAVKNAHKKEGVVARFGSWGLLVLTVTPVGFVSPIVVAAIGQLMGLSVRRVLVPIFAGMFIMTTVLVWLFVTGLAAAARLHPALPFVLTGTLVAGLASREVYLRIKARRARKDGRARAP